MKTIILTSLTICLIFGRATASANQDESTLVRPIQRNVVRRKTKMVVSSSQEHRRNEIGSSTKAPSENCEDYEGVFTIKGDKRTCVWVGRANTKKRCEDSSNASFCPETCGLCGTTECEDEDGSFEDEDGNRRTCAWVARLQTAWRCTLSDIAEHCPVTCGTCA